MTPRYAMLSLVAALALAPPAAARQSGLPPGFDGYVNGVNMTFALNPDGSIDEVNARTRLTGSGLQLCLSGPVAEAGEPVRGEK